VLAFMLDSADGQVARLQKSSSSSGEWLDHVLDCAVKISLHSAVLIALYRHGDRGALLLLPLAFLLVSVLFFFGGILVGKLREQSAAATPTVEGDGLRRQLLMLPIDHGVTCVAFVLWGWQSVFLGVYALLFAATALCLVAFSAKWLREMS
jgi:phosphatidylglycerophosphate synthase